MRRPTVLAARVLAVAALLVGVTVAPALGYMIVLKDGTRLESRGAPKVREGIAYFTLTSGTQTSLDADEIDFAATETYNASGYGSAQLIEGVGAEAPPPSLPENDEPKLADLARGASLSRPEARRRSEPVDELGPLPRTAAGFVDLMEVRHVEHPDSEVSGELARFLRGQGYDRVSIFQGTAADRVLLELPANSEAAVFKGLRDAANALVQLRDRFGDRVGVLELLMATTTSERRSRAGQFELTHELATLLANGEMKADDFFLAYVQF